MTSQQIADLPLPEMAPASAHSATDWDNDPSSVFYVLNEGYARARRFSGEARSLLKAIERIHDDPETADDTREECADFLRDPEAWPHVKGYRLTGEFAELDACQVRAEELRAEPYEEIVFALADLYQSELRTAHKDAYEEQIRKIAVDDATPELARSEALRFLFAPEKWVAVRLKEGWPYAMREPKPSSICCSETAR